MGLLFGVPIVLPQLLLAVLTTAVFAALAISTACWRVLTDQGMLNSFVITPMAFLCGTFFPVDTYPQALQWFIKILPLTPASQLVRSAAAGHGLPMPWLGYLTALAVMFVGAAIFMINRTKD